MCTVTLLRGVGSLLLTMNRDERYDRAPEEPPRRIPGDPGRPSWLAPFDSVSGGTWIGVNDRGVVSCLLNGYEPGDEPLRGRAGVPSRGSIIPRILEGQDGVGPARLPETLDFSAYPSFTLLVASNAGGQIVCWRQGVGLDRDDVPPGWTLLTSSSWSEPSVGAFRRSAFEDWRAAGDPETHGLPALHLSAPAGDEASAVFMTRNHSATRSITQVRVDAARGVASLVWWPRRGSSRIDAATPGASLEFELATAEPPLAESRRA